MSKFVVTYNCMSAVLGAILPVDLFYAINIINFLPTLYLTFISIVAFFIGLHLYDLAIFDELNNINNANNVQSLTPEIAVLPVYK